MPRLQNQGAQTAARIFRAIWRRPRISRVGLADRLGLDKSTVTNQVNLLIEMGLIEEVEEGSASSRGGRRPIQLSIRRSYGRILGLEIQADTFVAVSVDLAGEILGECRGSVDVAQHGFGASLDRSIQHARQVLDQGPGVLLGIGIGLGGLVDHRAGLVRYSVPLAISEPLDFAREVADRLDVPCCVENDANCCAWGELAFHRSEELRDFLFALVEYRRGPTSVGSHGGIGVGFGLVLGGKVHGGSHGNAGEFRSALCTGPGPFQFSLSGDELSRYATDQDALQRTSDELARNMALLINTLDFDQVFVGGDIEGLPLDFPALLRQRMEENWMYPCPKDIVIRYSSLGAKAVAYGAAGMILDRLVSENLLPGFGNLRQPLVPSSHPPFPPSVPSGLHPIKENP